MVNQDFKQMQVARQNSLRDFVRVLFRHKWQMMVFFLATVGTVTLMTWAAPHFYRSEAKVMVRLGRESVTVDPTATTIGPIVPVSRTRESEIQTELEILNSQTVARKVVEKIGPDAFEAAMSKVQHPVKRWLAGIIPSPSSAGTGPAVDPKEKATSALQAGLKIERTGGRESNVIAIRYQAPDPQFAQNVLATTIKVYLDEHMSVYRTPGSYQFFAQQYELTKKRLQSLQTELDDLRKKLGVLSLDEQIRIALARADRIKEEIVRTQAGVSGSTARIAKLEAALEKLPATIVTAKTTGFPNPPIDAIRARLNELHLMLEELASKYDDNSRPIQDLRRQILKAEQLAAQDEATRTEVTEGLNASRVTLEGILLTEQATLSSLQAQLDVLNNDLEAVQAELKNLNDIGGKIRDLTREIGIEEENYRRYASSLEQARVDEAMQQDKISNISIIQPATMPMLPAGPNKPLLVALGLVLAILGSITIAIVAEHADHSIKTPDDVSEQLALPTLASIPLTRRGVISPAGRTRSLLGLLRRQAPAEARWTLPTAIKTQYELLREAVVFACQGGNGNKTGAQGQEPLGPTEGPAEPTDTQQQAKRPRKQVRPAHKLIGLVASQKGEGVSIVAANLAAMLAERGRVLLVDANVKDPSSHQIFGMRVSFGLLDVLANGKDWHRGVWKTPVENLDLMPIGTAQDKAEVDMSQFQRLLRLVGRQYDYVVLDLPAVKEAGYTVRLAGLCDQVGLVVEAERSRWEVVRRTTEYLDLVQANVLGVILNKRRYHIPGWLYRAL